MSNKEMKKCTFVTDVPGAKQLETMELDAERILIGSGAHCDIRLPMDVAAFEHVIVTPEDGMMVARSVRGEATVRLNGEPLYENVLPENGVIEFDGGVKITFRSSEASSVRRKGAALSPLSIISLLLLPVVLLMFYQSEAKATLAPPAKVPDPLNAPVTVCSASHPQQALALAEQKEEIAQAKRQRWKFYTQDGVEAVALFETAEVCYRAAGDLQRSSHMNLFSRGMRAGVLEEYQLYRVRLERALAKGDSKAALAQVRFLRGLLVNRSNDDEYLQWLALVQSKLEAQLSR
jgi:hypothetical protein